MVLTMARLDLESQRIVYIVTYSRADTEKFPTRETFGNAVVEAWGSCKINVVQWVVCLEAHANTEPDEDMNLYHFHMALKLERRGRWLQVKKYLADKFGIQVHFSDHHNSYYSAYKYVTKEDTETYHSHGHPDLTGACPRTESAIAGKKRKGKGASKSKRKEREERMSIYDVSKLIQAKSITTRLQLVCLAMAQERDGKRSLAQFVANRGHKAVDEALSLAK